MDPTATLAAFLCATTNDQRADHMDCLRTWYAKGGFKPLVQQVRANVERQGRRWTRRMHITALLGGAI